MSKIPQQPPSVGEMTPLSPEEGGQSSSKSKIKYLRDAEMKTPSTSEAPKSTKEGDNDISKMWVRGEPNANEFTSKASSAGIIRNLKKTFDQI